MTPLLNLPMKWSEPLLPHELRLPVKSEPNILVRATSSPLTNILTVSEPEAVPSIDKRI